MNGMSEIMLYKSECRSSHWLCKWVGRNVIFSVVLNFTFRTQVLHGPSRSDPTVCLLYKSKNFKLGLRAIHRDSHSL